MDKKYIEENEIDIKYLRDQLTPEEVEEFEICLMEDPDMVDSLEIDGMFVDSRHDFSKLATRARVDEHNLKNGFSLNRIYSWITVPIPAYASVAAAMILAPILANQFSTNQLVDIELASFSSSVTRGENRNISDSFDLRADLSRLERNAAIMIKVTPDVQEFYILEVYDYSESENHPIWTSSLFAVNSGTRDHIIALPDAALVANAKLRVLGKEQNGKFIPVKFCHYSEICL